MPIMEGHVELNVLLVVLETLLVDVVLDFLRRIEEAPLAGVLRVEGLNLSKCHLLSISCNDEVSWRRYGMNLRHRRWH